MRRRNRPDGMDHEDSSYPDRSCSGANHRRSAGAGSHWEDLCSSCSQSSDEEIRAVQPNKKELYVHAGDSRDYQTISLLPHGGPSAGVGQSVELGSPPYSGNF